MTPNDQGFDWFHGIPVSHDYSIPGGMPIYENDKVVDHMQWNRKTKNHEELCLFDMSVDPGESNNLAANHPEVVAELMKQVEAFHRELGERRKFKAGPEVRSIGEAQKGWTPEE